ncbi:hypothetical protein VPHD249_0078 [Vibrio phage D249]|nr:hypothetical protein SIPHO036v1_110003 [Vibrio phage 70E38.1]QZI87985.1 hypothetical protein SIPHO041v1_p0074 [Vibrio phage 234P1]QZI88155.1 hypothetical protein SIPHO035v1_p0064 [Vibrio phage 234P7B]QZI88376.1 hypothetical protein SIPHO082v1_p0099 [Vibrio phage 294E48.1]QZI88525.1 hypothetical protein SIPHO037v1_p0084 [Vibrio phage 70E35.2]QZI88709.1 hypothetical protein SIPHO039v1_p0080 [Vibrio phage 70E35.5a]QZI88893.1 hypothetical protein SIPHO040v1_p0080 [Vibrio phage 70E35.6]QZI8912
MLNFIAKKALQWSIRRLYSSDSPKRREEFIRKVNNETWLSAHMSSGGHALRDLKPIGMEETISVVCVLSDSCTYDGKDHRFTKVDYYNANWKS